MLGVCVCVCVCVCVVCACACVCVNQTFSIDPHNLQFIERQTGLLVLFLHKQRHITAGHSTFAIQFLCLGVFGEACGIEAHRYAGLVPCLFTLDAPRNPDLKVREAWCLCRADGNHR